MASVAGSGFAKITDYLSGAQITRETSYKYATTNITWTMKADCFGIGTESTIESGKNGNTGTVIHFKS